MSPQNVIPIDNDEIDEELSVIDMDLDNQHLRSE